MEEIWKDVVGYEGDYQISSLGNVKTLKKGKNKILSPADRGTGYLAVSFYKDGKSKSWSIHKLVAVAFLNHKPDKYIKVVDHIDNNKLNNKLNNLQVISNRLNASKNRKIESKSKSKYTGVYWNKSAKKWHTQIDIKGKSIHLGFFECELKAAKTYSDYLNNYLKLEEHG